ncbi:MAG: 50S ribosomal protein L9 [Bacteroidetes bacterium]|nr:50S ribosomal protein L9 [Bacteroidota bacterium]
MKIILKDNVEKLGKAGEIVDVKPGYARNFLVPQGLGLIATKANQAVYEVEKKRIEARIAKDKSSAEEMAAKLEAASLTMPVSAGEEDRLFGSVTSQDIADALHAQGLEVDKRKILLEEPIKALGLYDVNIKLHSEVTGKVKVWVVKKEA